MSLLQFCLNDSQHQHHQRLNNWNEKTNKYLGQDISQDLIEVQKIFWILSIHRSHPYAIKNQ